MHKYRVKNLVELLFKTSEKVVILCGLGGKNTGFIHQQKSLKFGSPLFLTAPTHNNLIGLSTRNHSVIGHLYTLSTNPIVIIKNINKGGLV